jgi:hypothetical protein
VNSRELARELLRFSHTMLEISLDKCAVEDLFRPFPGSEVNSVGAIYAHVVLGEDHFVANHLGEAPLYAAASWQSAFGFEPQLFMSAEWTASLRYDLAAFRAYAEEVLARSDRFLAALGEEAAELPAPVYDVQRGADGKVTYEQVSRPLIYALMDNVTLHTCEHTGEIDAITGLMGRLRG